MAETKDPEGPALPAKRKPELSCEENINPPNKTQKLVALNNNSSEISDGKTFKSDEERVDSESQEDNVEEDEDDDDDDEDEVDGNGEASVDRKGKGILIEEKEGDSDDDDDDSSDRGSQSDGDSDLSDDPLAEVDLDNILPSRTRRKVIQPGEYIANDLANDEDSDSDDEDA